MQRPGRSISRPRLLRIAIARVSRERFLRSDRARATKKLAKATRMRRISTWSERASERKRQAAARIDGLSLLARPSHFPLTPTPPPPSLPPLSPLSPSASTPIKQLPTRASRPATKSSNIVALVSSSSSSSRAAATTTSRRRASVSTAAAASTADAGVEVSRRDLADGAAVELTVTVPASAVEAAWQAAMKRARKGSNVPGFRKGAKVRREFLLLFFFVEKKEKEKENPNRKKKSHKKPGKIKKNQSRRSPTTSSSTTSAGPPPSRPSRQSTSSAPPSPARWLPT